VSRKIETAILWVESRFSGSHLRWSVMLAGELQKRGIRMVLASSTLQRAIDIPDEIILVELPGWRAESGPDKYLTCNGKTPLDDDVWRDRRRKIMIDLCKRYSPEYFITETWPLAKGDIYDNELLAAINLCPGLTHFYCLIMDIPVFTSSDIKSPSGGGLSATLDFMKKKSMKVISTGDGRFCNTGDFLGKGIPLFQLGYFFGSDEFVHSNNRPLSQPTFLHKMPGFLSKKSEKRVGDPIGSSTSFEGFVPDQAGILAGGGLGKRLNIEDTVIVTAGAGFKDEDEQFYVSAIRAKVNSLYDSSRWIIYVSADCPTETRERIEDAARTSSSRGNVTVMVNSSRFTRQIAYARFLIARSGYYTAMPALLANLSMIIVPRPSSREQQLRSEYLSKRGVTIIAQSDSLLSSLHECLDKEVVSTYDTHDIQLGGHRAAADLIYK
jgi:predicted glycosyltransferase